MTEARTENRTMAKQPARLPRGRTSTLRPILIVSPLVGARPDDRASELQRGELRTVALRRVTSGQSARRAVDRHEQRVVPHSTLACAGPALMPRSGGCRSNVAPLGGDAAARAACRFRVVMEILGTRWREAYLLLDRPGPRDVGVTAVQRGHKRHGPAYGPCQGQQCEPCRRMAGSQRASCPRS
jgi:hypothetical protein